MELETHLLLIGRLGYRPAEDVEPLLAQCSEIGKMLSGLSKSLRGKQ
jgi:four helix bundle protein